MPGIELEACGGPPYWQRLPPLVEDHLAAGLEGPAVEALREQAPGSDAGERDPGTAHLGLYLGVLELQIFDVDELEDSQSSTAHW